MKYAYYFFLAILQQLAILSGGPDAMAAEEAATVLPRQVPRYELGVGGAYFYVPDYPGAEESRSRVLALPYFIYRGEIWRADREGGFRGRFIKSENLEGDLSFNASFNANSAHNDARAGMPDIDWIGEVGPRLAYHIVKDRANRLSLSLPLRFVFSADVESWEFFVKERGLTFNPQLSFSHRGIFGPTTMVRTAVGATWATEKLMDYFYQVDPQFATAERPAYDAREGYMSTEGSLSFMRFFPQHDVAAFVGVTWSFYGDAENRRSPLLLDTVTESYAAGLVWSIHKSKDLASGE